jgi:hypothetical protein
MLIKDGLNKQFDELGNKQCINVQEQCFYGEDMQKSLLGDKRREAILKKECGSRKGGIVYCCPFNLINEPYQPGPYEIPFQVQVTDDKKYRSCPEEIKAGCFREKDRDKPLCIQNACNDAGYRVANNYYEICKAYSGDDIRSSNQEVDNPDCLAVGCWGNRFKIEDITIDLGKPKADEDIMTYLTRLRGMTIDEITEFRGMIDNMKKDTKNEDTKRIEDIEHQITLKEKRLTELNKLLTPVPTPAPSAGLHHVAEKPHTNVPMSQPKSPISQPKSPISQPKSPISQPKSPISQPKSPISQPKSPISQPKSPISQLKPKISAPKSSIASKPQPKSQVKSQISKIKQKGSGETGKTGETGVSDYLGQSGDSMILVLMVLILVLVMSSI